MNNKHLVIRIAPGEGIGMLYDDTLRPQRLGDLEVRRVSYVPFNDGLQKWVVVLVDGTVLGAFDSRQEAIDEEVRYMNLRIEAGTVEHIFSAQKFRITEVRT